MQIVVENSIINYRLFENQSSAQYLVILPGWMRTSNEWVENAKTLSKKYNVLVIDFPGFGVSPISSADFDTYEYARLTQEFLRKLHITECFLLGHSFGGRVAIVLASTSDMVKRLILLDTAGITRNRMFHGLYSSIGKFVKNLLRALSPKLLLKVRKYVGSQDYNTAGEMRSVLSKVVNQDLTPHLGKIKTPSLIVWGDKDKEVSIKMTKILSRLVPNSSVRIVWGAGHDPHIEKSQKFLEILQEFI